MKHLKLVFYFSMFLMAVTFTSCLKDENSKPTGLVFVTIENDYGFNCTFYADGGGILKPSAASIAQFAALKDMKRALIQYSYQDGFTPTAETTEFLIDVLAYQEIRWSNVKILPTEDPQDTLRINNDSIQSFVDNSLFFDDKYCSAYAYRGYVNLVTSFKYESRISPYISMAYNPEKDIVKGATKDTLFMKLYFDNRSKDPAKVTSTAPQVLSNFCLPRGLQYEFSGREDIVIGISADIKDYYGKKMTDTIYIDKYKLNY
ncbi:MAG: hypothetical protein RR319_01480 [Bacteroides sp.]